MAATAVAKTLPPWATAVVTAGTEVPFKVGLKNVFLPNARLTFIEPKKGQPPTFATFIVPMRFNKLDMRDYLYHAYNVEVRHVRAFINPGKLERHERLPNGAYKPIRTKRSAPTKMMTVELVQPFLFPQAPEDLSPWDNSIFKKLVSQGEANEERQKNAQKLSRYTPPSKMPMTSDRAELAQRARMLRSGQEQWRNEVDLDEKWLEVEDEPKAAKQ